jgi:hypothetical protein
MSDADELGRQWKASIVDRLVACGVNADRIIIEHQDDLQDYEILITEPPLPREQIAAIRAAAGTNILTLENPANRDLSKRLVHEETRDALTQEAAKMPGLPRFDPERVTLAEFAREIEAWCGVEPGSVLKADDEFVLGLRDFDLSMPPDERMKAARVMHAASVALADYESVGVGMGFGENVRVRFVGIVGGT